VINKKGGCGKSTLVLSLAQILDADIVDMDPQRTLTHAAKVTGKCLPIKLSEATRRYVICDTPPHSEDSLYELIKSADFVLVPVLIGYPDLLATKTIVNKIKSYNAEKKSCIVYSKVRNPPNRAHKDIKALFSKAFPTIKIAKTELSELKSFQEVLAKNLEGKAKEQVRALADELGL
jgi:cellulose biosynthesis protein BcsQ